MSRTTLPIRPERIDALSSIPADLLDEVTAINPAKAGRALSLIRQAARGELSTEESSNQTLRALLMRLWKPTLYMGFAKASLAERVRLMAAYEAPGILADALTGAVDAPSGLADAYRDDLNAREILALANTEIAAAEDRLTRTFNPDAHQNAEANIRRLRTARRFMQTRTIRTAKAFAAILTDFHQTHALAA